MKLVSLFVFKKQFKYILCLLKVHEAELSYVSWWKAIVCVFGLDQ
jgi:hypothetical protein